MPSNGIPAHLLVTRTCERCGNPFQTPRAEIARGKGRFCSRACKWPSLTERLTAKIGPPNSHGCREWTGDTRRGYGAIWHNGRNVGTHRLVWELAHGRPVQPGHLIAHHCDNPPCCEITHLFETTYLGNHNDMKAKDRSAKGDRSFSRLHPERLARGDRHGARRQPERLARGERHGSRTKPDGIPRGERHGQAKLTVAAVLDIRTRYQPHKVTLAQLASEYGIDFSTVGDIIRRKIWKHI
jgi:hypothetical protein